jgi:hypothetical protein
MVKLPHFKKLKTFKVYDKRPYFDVVTFSDFIKQNGGIYTLTFCHFDESWYKTLETSLENSDFNVSMKNIDGYIPYSRTIELQHLVVIEIQLSRDSDFIYDI